MPGFREYAERRAIAKKLLDRYGKYSFYLVDGEQVRDVSSKGEEFGGSGDWIFYPGVIPKDEVWIEDSVKESERPVLVASELYFLRLVERGKSKDAAYDAMLAKEKGYRESLSRSRQDPSATDEKADPEVYARRYGRFAQEDVDVFLVDGRKVRDEFKTDFIEGGHGYVYRWIPNDEIWMELGEHLDEYPYILLHEFVERTLMKYRHAKYDAAHKIAAKAEFAARGKGEFTKRDALSMSARDALTLAKKYSG